MPISYHSPIRWIAFKDGHQVSLNDVTPDSINFPKSHIHMDGRAKRKFGLTTARNHVAKLLGSNGSGKAYEQFFETQLKPFMDENGLVTPTDLIHSQEISSVPSFKPRQVADRIFKGRPMPSEIFTGWNIPWDDYDNGDAPFWQITQGGLFLPRTTPPTDGFSKLVKALEGTDDCAAFFEAGSLELGYPAERAAKNGRRFAKAFTKERCFDEFIYRMRLYCPNCNSMLGNLFLRFPEEVALQASCKQYYPASMTDKAIAEAKREEVIATEVYRKWVESKKTGWIKVLPFNANLIFLSDGQGRYDFLIRGAKDRKFSHKIFGESADSTAMPKAQDTYHFERWLHFEYDGWEEKDRDAAEHAFYQTGEIRDYPGATLFRDYLKTKGDYSPPLMVSNKVLPGFTPVETEHGKKLAVSNIVSIGQFRAYLLKNQKALTIGNGMLGAVNADIYPDSYIESDSTTAQTTPGLCALSEQDVDQSGAAMPAAVTWNDACAFAQWVQNGHDVPVRLLHCDEYQDIFGNIVPTFASKKELKTALFTGVTSDGTICSALRQNEKPYRAGQDFQHFDKARLQASEKQHPSGIKAVTASDFGEWLSATHRAINTLTHTHVHYPEGPLHDTVGVGSTGEYKGAKIGFRLCYEMAD